MIANVSLSDPMTSTLPLPPKPSSPALWQTLQFGRRPVEFLTDCMHLFGDVFRLDLVGMGHWVFFCSPTSVRQVFKAPPGTLCAGEIHSRLVGSLFGTDSTFNLDGDRHKARQRLVMPLLNGSAVNQYVDMIREVAMETYAENRGAGVLPLLKINHRLSLRILIRAAFGDGNREFNQRFADAFERFADLGARSALSRVEMLRVDLGPWSPWGKLLRMRERLRSDVRERIRARRPELEEDEAEPETILDHLVAASLRDDSGVTEEGIIDEVVTLLFAGHETTGALLTWVLAMIQKHPDVRAKVLTELSRVVGPGPVRAEHVRDLKYLQAVVDESHRYNPIGPFAAFRQVMKPWEIEGERGRYQVPAGYIVAHSFPIMSLREDLYPEPLVFRPERFLESDPEPYHWTPFGGGGRVCSGRGLATVELKVVTATLLRSFEIRPAQSEFRRVRVGQFIAPEKGLPASIS